MIDDELKKLAGGNQPKASPEARQKAISSGLDAFKETIEANRLSENTQSEVENSQGFFNFLGLIHEGHKNLWRRLMITLNQKRLMAGTAMATIAAFVITIAVVQHEDPMKVGQPSLIAPPKGIDGQIDVTDSDDDKKRDERLALNEVKDEAQPITSEQKGQQIDSVAQQPIVVAEPVIEPTLEADPVPAVPLPAQRFAYQDSQVEEIVVSGVRRADKKESDKSYGLIAPQAEPEPAVVQPMLLAEVSPSKNKRVRALTTPRMDSDTIIRMPEPNRDQFDGAEPNKVKSVAEDPVSTLSVDVDTASYSVVRRSLMNGYLPNPEAVRVEEMINYFDYDYALPAEKAQPFKPTVNIYQTPWNEDTKLMHIGIKGHDLDADVKPAANLVFLLDVSGSMNQKDKLPLLKNAFRMLVSTLSDDDTVSIVTYAGRAGVVLEPTAVKDKSKIFAALENLRAGGSTAGAQGIEAAYALAESSFKKDGVNRVMLATDGDFNVGITDRDQLKAYVERKRETGIFLSVLGFGMGNYNDALMQDLAQNGNGVATYIDTLNEARKVLVEEASSTLYPIAKDVKIQIEFNPIMVAEYRLIGYETRLLNRADFNNDKVDAAEIGAGHSVTAIYEITPVGSDAQMIDPLRYSDEKKSESGKGGEYAFLKMRYKLPREDTSKLLSLAVTSEHEVESLSDDVRFATSVAAFGQLLRGESMMKGYKFDDVEELALSARGDDHFGYRAEFINLVRLAKTSK